VSVPRSHCHSAHKAAEHLAATLRATEDQLTALDRRFYSRGSVWISLVLITSGIVLTVLGAKGNVDLVS